MHLKSQFIECYEEYLQRNHHSHVVFSVEDVECAVHALKCNKAAGPELLGAEHLQCAGRRPPVLLTKLFYSCLVHGYVPDNFGTSFIVPVPKGDINKLSVFEGYRPVSLISVISKVFEICLLNVFTRLIVTEDLQFGFTSGKGCQKASLVMSTVLYYFNEKVINVYIAGLDVSKAFDSVNHYGIFVKLINVNIPLCVLNIL